MAKTHLPQSAWCRASRCLVKMSSKLVQALCAPGAAKDPAIGSIAQALVACVPSSAFSSEVDLLLSSLNDRPASIMVVVPQDGLDVRIGLVSFGQTIFSFGQHLLRPVWMFLARSSLRSSTSGSRSVCVACSAASRVFTSLRSYHIL